MTPPMDSAEMKAPSEIAGEIMREVRDAYRERLKVPGIVDNPTLSPGDLWAIGCKAVDRALATRTPPKVPDLPEERVWLWRNFVDGRPEYWAFDNPFPCEDVGGDPLTLGQPCGWALLKHSVNGRPDKTTAEVEAEIARTAATIPAQDALVGECRDVCGDALELLNSNVITPDALNAVGRKLEAFLAKLPASPAVVEEVRS